MELARAMLLQRGLPTKLWAEAVHHAAYICYQAPTQALDNKTPYEAWEGKKPDVLHLREFGCNVWILHKGDQSKLDAKALKRIFVGFKDGPGAIRYYNPATNQVLISRDAYFNEDDILRPKIVKIKTNVEPTNKNHNASAHSSAIEGESQAESNRVPSSDLSNSKNLHFNANWPPSNNPSEPMPNTDAPRSSQAQKTVNYRTLDNPSRRKIIVPAQQSRPAITHQEAQNESAFFVRALLAGESSIYNVPESLAQAKKLPEWEGWEKGVFEELQQLKERGMWRLKKLPEGRKAIENRWTFAKKFDPDGKLSRYKTRLVAQGFSQIPGQDFDQTYSPVMRLESFRNIVSLIAILNLDVGQMDIKGAYLNGNLCEETYIQQPQGYNDRTNRVCRLIHTLYGLKQSGHKWNQRLNKYLNSIGYTHLDVKHCVYLRRDKSGFDILAIWVDNIFFACTATPGQLNKCKAKIKKEFDATSQDPCLLLGIEINRDCDCRTIKILQGLYIQKVLEQFNMANSGTIATPVNPLIHLMATTNATQFENSLTYCAAIGLLMYATIGTRPDLAFSIQLLSQFSANPLNEHWTAVKRVFCYLQGTKDFGITYAPLNNDNCIEFTGFSNADWGSDRNRRSILGYAFLLGGSAISWSSKKQPTVSLSSMEAEYMAATNAARQIIWLQNFFLGLGFPQSHPSDLYIDNHSAIDLAKNPEFYAQSKHINIRHHFIRKVIKNGHALLNWCPTDNMTADIFTKALSRPKFEKFVQELGMS